MQVEYPSSVVGQGWSEERAREQREHGASDSRRMAGRSVGRSVVAELQRKK